MLDIASGEVVAMVSLPDYNPNHFAAIEDDARFNRATPACTRWGRHSRC